MKLGSLFDGSGGFPLSGVLNGIEPVWAAEVEPYPIAVTRSRFPHMKHYGDVSQMHGGEVEPVDIITFGSPCQDMSVAGKRAGLDGGRSNLFFEAVRIVKEMREATNGKYPKYAVWENVPGAFSSNKGHDFHAVLEALCSVCDGTVSIPKPYDAKRANQLVWSGAGEIVGDSYSIAWRTLDAQYWGVPQRRKRIYLVADFTGGRAGEILFVETRLRRDMQTGDEAGQGSTADVVGSVDGGVRAAGFLSTQGSKAMGVGFAMEQSPTLRAGLNGADVVIALQANGIDRADTAGCNGCGWRENESYTLNTVDRHAVCYGIDQQGGKGGANYSENTMPPMCSDSHGTPHAVCYENHQHGGYREGCGTLRASGGDYGGGSENVVCYDARGNGDGETVPTMTGDYQNRITDYTAVAVQEAKPPRRYIIRRLLPVECARLQGFPDDWGHLAPYNPSDADFWEGVRKTHAEINGKKYKPVKNLKAWYEKLHNDGAEYKMWGNGIALPCAEYVLRGIAEEDER